VIYYLSYLKHSQYGLPERVKVVPLFLLLGLVVEPAAEHLHAEQREDHDEQEQKQQEREDGLDGVEQRSHEVG
jgi:hypothetical protein